MKEWLEDCESKWNVEILFACEAGSRAWGTDSVGSDEDLRFIYRHRDIRSYLSLKKPLEVIDINLPIDAHGWDIFKAFQLASKSNPSLYEWAYSPINYVDKNHFSMRLREIIVENYSPFSVAMHYLSLITRNLKEVGNKENLGKKQQKQLIQILRSTIILHNIITNGVAFDPFSIMTQDNGDVWTYYYNVLVEAKRVERLAPTETLRSIILSLEIERDKLERSCHQLSKGEAFNKKLDQWLWEILSL